MSDQRPVAPGVEPASSEGETPRRGFLAGTGTAIMAGSLAASYGTLGAMAGKFLYPAQDTPRAWLFLGEVNRLKVGDSFTYRAPDGATIAVARTGSSGGEVDFLALSSVCPHLGCQVHWEGKEQRFFCPCHNGTFDPSGKATGGPPAAAGQSLKRYPLKVERGLLYIEVPVEANVADGGASPAEQGGVC